ncbi:glycoside hydrolase family 2 TIM barrel-domain containing protein [Pseudoxanthomonas indica]|uniref:Glycoside hydrolase family 2 catalytic domain-containing protein n=1 Tax=Pseudoxanthomonas indica TaxID=428993 RepID=A0A1T5JY85_9GAMM|nr:glycoside hydrolase family 2 TIM barrel-domain containing protein [Pseudoxanthomonas indica]GGD45265.1 hypothetical protein GCM10007235_16480 [Pseudoxanthomonas indica]SKC56305.1 protein of unknown function [Pseudoxanthomonas indica]
MRQAWRRRVGLWLGLALACSGVAAAQQPASTSSGAAVVEPAPAVVKIVRQGASYQLQVNGQPFYIKGGGLGDIDQETLLARGGNSFRTWSTGDDTAKVRAMLDRAQRNGLKVAMGLDVARERHGFDYDDATAVAAQQKRIETEVALYKDHPAVLMWLVGNELNLEHKNPKVWNAVNDITLAIHRLDPNHPVMTPLAGFTPALIAEIKARAPALDLIGVQLYGDINELPAKLRASKWTGPYVVTEWGPTGHWESPLTSWGAAIEDDASRKAGRLMERYQSYIASDKRQGLGSYVFLWGQKQERTPTWYGLFLKSGESTPSVDAMQYLWTGQWPDNRAPAIQPILIDGLAATKSVSVAPGSEHEAHVQAEDAEQDPLRFQWYVLRETTATTTGGDHEDVPAAVRVRMTFQGQGGLKFQAPQEPGAYRLFVEVRDGHGHAAYANFPFQVSAAP